ncbi:alpha-2-macroglobulin family protein [bacterium]|nr:alpha-2-macroglobulin family protein [bacterium]MBU1884314.1 alpha-2-macroglobulin family protein [bacterium]
MFKKVNKKFVGIVSVFLVALGALAYIYFNSDGKASLKIASTSFPSVTRYDRPDNLSITFQNTADMHNKNYQKQLSSPIAPLNMIDKEVIKGVSISPAISGAWMWSGEKTLTFIPKQDWPASQDFVVRLDQSLFDKNALKLTNNSVEWVTPYFQASIQGMHLEQDIAGGKDHNIFATITFTHPVDKSSLEQNLKLLDLANSKIIPFELTYEPNLKTAYLRSNTIPIMEKEYYLSLILGKGVKTTLGNTFIYEPKESKKLIPDIYSFLKLNEADYSIINDKDGNPEQIFHISLTDAVTFEEFSKYTSIAIDLRNKSDLTTFNNSNAISHITILPIQGTSSKDYFIKSEIPFPGSVYVTLLKGMKSINGFELRRDIKEGRSIPSYPTELKIMGEGSVLALSGEKKLSFAVRGLSGLKVTVQKLQDEQINHLVSQTNGDMTSPEFKSYTFNAENITDKQLEETISLAKTNPKDQNYASLDLSKYLRNHGSGIFFVKVEDYNIKQHTRDYYLSDQRLIVVTDMGIVVKKARDGSKDVFVESISSGKPVSGAKVSVLGKNGQAIDSKYTSSGGKVSFINLNSYVHAQTPTVIVVKKDNDLSFIPYEEYTRNINFSQFDIGGISSSDTDKDHELSAYAFSDRGIYRPGENVHLASIVKQGNFNLQKGTVVRAKVYDARNKLIYKEDFSLDKSGLFEIDMPTSLVSPTGNYTFSVYLPTKTSSGYENEDYLGGASFSVEEFQPDTMKIKTRFNPHLASGWIGLKDIKAEVTLSNLFGLPAQNRNIHARATVAPTQFHFGKFADYRFVAPHLDEKILRQENIEFNDMKTDKAGFASFDVLVPYDSGEFRLNFEAEGFEPDGGRSVRAKAMTLISDASYMLGVKADGDISYLKKDQDRSLNFIAVDPQLNKIALKNLKLDVIYNKRLSVLTKQRDGRYRYETVIQKDNVLSKPFSIDTEGTNIKLDTHLGGDFTLNISDENGKLLSSVDYYVATKGNMTGALEKDAELTIKLDKQTYKPGEEIEMNIVAPYTGTGLITIESDAVHAHKWFSTTTKSSIQKIVLPAGLEGNAYVNVTFVRSIDSKEIFTSPLSYTVAPFNINSEKRRIKIDLETPKLIKPGEELSIKYKTDRKAKIVVYAINEGILQVAKYELPDPLKHFLKKRALLVQTFQILDLILPEFSRYVEASGIGGDMMEAMAKSALGANLNPFQRTLDKPAVYWSGVIDADTNEKELKFRVPDTFNGSLKVMAVAVSDEAMGSVYTKTEVRGPFVLSPNVLTMAAPNDEFEVTVGVSNAMKGSGKDVPVDISIDLSNNLKLLSQKKVTKKISEGDEDKVTFRVKATDSLGEGKITFTAKNADVFQTRTATLSIRPAQNYETTVTAGYKKDVGVIKSDRTLYKELASKTLSASNSPFVLATGLTDYLASYPHGCTEQIVSQTFPWVALSKSSKFEDIAVDTRANAVISMLQTRQMGDGGFSLWPSSNYTNEFASLYAMHFLTELKDTSTSVSIPKNLYDGGMDYLRSIARKETSNMEEARRRAMAIYLLIRNQEVATNYLVDLHDELQKSGDDWKKDITSAYMAASYMLLKKSDVAHKLIKDFDPSYETGYTDFQSNLTMNAQYIYLVSTHFPDMELNVDDNIMPLLKPVIQGKLNTISASYTVLALSAYSQRNEQKYGKDELEFYTVGKKKVALPKSVIKPFMMAKVPLQEPELTIESKSPLFYQLVQSGYDKNPQSQPLAKGIEIFKEYVDKNGTIVHEVKQGDELEVRIKVRALDKSYISNVVLIDLLPGGFEVIRDSVPRDNGDWKSDYVDVREDRVVFYASFSNTLTELRYKVKATAAGDFIVPSASAASMYDPDIISHTAASKMKVKSADTF